MRFYDSIAYTLLPESLFFCVSFYSLFYLGDIPKGLSLDLANS